MESTGGGVIMQSNTPRCDEMENAEAWRDPAKWVTELQVSWSFARHLEREAAQLRAEIDGVTDKLESVERENDKLRADRDALVVALYTAKTALLDANRSGWHQKNGVFAAVNEALAKHGSK